MTKTIKKLTMVTLLIAMFSTVIFGCSDETSTNDETGASTTKKEVESTTEKETTTAESTTKKEVESTTEKETTTSEPTTKKEVESTTEKETTTAETTTKKAAESTTKKETTTAETTTKKEAESTTKKETTTSEPTTEEQTTEYVYKGERFLVRKEFKDYFDGRIIKSGDRIYINEICTDQAVESDVFRGEYTLGLYITFKMYDEITIFEEKYLAPGAYCPEIPYSDNYFIEYKGENVQFVYVESNKSSAFFDVVAVK